MSLQVQQPQVVILSAARLPSGRFLGGLSGIPAPQLGAKVIKAALERAGIFEWASIEEVFMGNVVSAGLGQAPARQASIYSGIPATVGATAINKVCGSGLKSVMLAANAIRSGEGDLFVAGGMESMSRAPFLVDGRTGSLRYGHSHLTDALLKDGLWDSFEDMGMGDLAEFIANEFGVTRQAMDEYAFHSHRKAIEAIDSGAFKEEVVPVEISMKKGQTVLFDTDEPPRRDTNIEGLSKLKPAFQKDGMVTAGNAPGLSDGAAAVVVSSVEKAIALGIKPIAKVIGYTQAAVEPRYLFDAPAHAIPKLIKKLGWRLQDVDLIELNEAFAAQTLANGYALKDYGWDWDKVNVNGGAIALGHPIGASGAKILTTLIYALKHRNLKRGIVALCLGGAEAVAMGIELVD